MSDTGCYVTNGTGNPGPLLLLLLLLGKQRIGALPPPAGPDSEWKGVVFTIFQNNNNNNNRQIKKNTSKLHPVNHIVPITTSRFHPACSSWMTDAHTAAPDQNEQAVEVGPVLLI